MSLFVENLAKGTTDDTPMPVGDDIIFTELKNALQELAPEGLEHGSWIRQIKAAHSFDEMLKLALLERMRGSIFLPAFMHHCIEEAFDHSPLAAMAASDLRAFVEKDPCIRYAWQPLLFCKGFHAIQLHRLAHYFWSRNNHCLALAIQHHASVNMAIDIHPAAKLGGGIFLDHATGLVIGETAEIGSHVSLLHGITLGSAGGGGRGNKRHPTVEDHVLIGAGAIILGDITVGAGSKIGAGAVVVKDVAPGTTVAGYYARNLHPI